jgi:hypothetical protein
MATHGIGRLDFIESKMDADVQIGDLIVMPAGGPWLIHHVWTQGIPNLSVVDKFLDGYIHLNSEGGDLRPDPEPGSFPLQTHPNPNFPTDVCQRSLLNIFRTRIVAPGKAQLSLNLFTYVGAHSWTSLSAGILFGTDIPVVRHSPWSAQLHKIVSIAGETLVGTITLPESATRITSFFGDLVIFDSIFQNETAICNFRLESPDTDFAPAVFPAFTCYHNVTAGSFGWSDQPRVETIPLDIPVLHGSRINLFANLLGDLSRAAYAKCFITYE